MELAPIESLSRELAKLLAILPALYRTTMGHVRNINRQYNIAVFVTE
jgi:hypothetical protein